MRRITKPRLLAAALSGTLILGACMMNQDTDDRTSSPDTTATSHETSETGTEDTSPAAMVPETTEPTTEPTTEATTEPATEPTTLPKVDPAFIPADELTDEEPSLFYKNPSRINGIGDPFIIRDHETGTYTMIATSASIGFHGWNSEDLVNWGLRHWAYLSPVESWSTDSYWAPEVVYHNDQYYMFYTARHVRGSLLISVAVSEWAEGLYIDVSDEPVFDPGFAIIDGSVFIDDDGSAYFYYTKDVSENIIDGRRVSESYGVKLTDDLLSLDGEPVLLVRPDQAWENPNGEWTWNEGPIVLKHEGRYYLAYSANYFEDPAYGIGYAVSDSPLGPYTKAPENPILTSLNIPGVSGSGHHSYIDSPDGSELFTAYHTHTVPENPSGNRQLALDRVYFTEDGKMGINGPTLSWLPAPSNDSIRLLQPEDYREGSDPELTDGQLAIHTTDYGKTVDLALNQDGEAVVTLELQEAKTIRGLTLVAGSGYRTNIAEIVLEIGDQAYALGEFLPEGPADHSFAGAIPPTVTDRLTFRFTPERAEQPVHLSEIYLIEEIKK